MFDWSRKTKSPASDQSKIILKNLQIPAKSKFCGAFSVLFGLGFFINLITFNVFKLTNLKKKVKIVSVNVRY